MAFPLVQGMGYSGIRRRAGSSSVLVVAGQAREHGGQLHQGCAATEGACLRPRTIVRRVRCPSAGRLLVLNLVGIRWLMGAL